MAFLWLSPLIRVIGAVTVSLPSRPRGAVDRRPTRRWRPSAPSFDMVALLLTSTQPDR